MKKVWNVYQHGILIGVSKNKHTAIQRLEFEAKRPMDTKREYAQDFVKEAHLKLGEFEAIYEQPK